MAGDVPLAPAGAAALAEAVAWAGALGHPYVGTEHLLLALAAREGEPTGRALAALRAPLPALRARLAPR